MKKVLFTATVDSHILHFHIPYLKLFKENGYEVHVATNGDEKIPYCDVKHKISFERNPIKLNNLKAIKQLKKVIDKEKFDIIHCHTPMGSVVTRLAAKKARRNGTRVIYTAHGFHFYKGAPLLNWLLFYPIEKYLSKYTDDLITINKEDYELAKRKFHARNTYYIPGVGVDPNKFNINLTSEEKHKLRKSLGLKDDDFVIIYVAELIKRKNQTMAIEAIKDLVKKDDKIKLLLVGKDSYNGKYQEMVKNLGIDKNVIFTGYRKDVPKLMKISDMAISTALQEGLPVNILEAMFVGLPIVCTNCRGNADLMIDTNNGYLVDINNVNSMINKITNIYNNRADIRTDFKLDKYEISNVMKKYSEIYFPKYKKAAYFHDVKLIECNNKIYTSDGLNQDVIKERYLNIFDSFKMVTRIIKNESLNIAKYSELNDKRISFDSINTSGITKLLFSKKVKEKIKENVLNVDFCIIRLHSFTGNIACKYARKYKKNYVIELVSCPFDSLWNHKSKFGKILAPYMYLLTKKNISKASNVIYVTDKFLQKRYTNKHNNIGCSDVIITDTDQSICTRRLEKITQMENKKIILGLVGSLDVSFKGHETAIKALAQLKDKIDFELHFLGNGKKDYWENIAKKYKIAEKVVFDGTLPGGKAVLEWMDNLDIYLIPSLQEGMPRALIEAMSRACPAIGTNVGGIPEVLDITVEKNDYIEIAKKILEFATNKDLMKKCALRNYEKSKEFHEDCLFNKRQPFILKCIYKNSGE